jgi:hypothetical protein
MSEKDRQNIAKYNHGKKAEHSDLYHYVYSFGGSVLVGIVDFIFIWPESHLLALLAAAAWFSLLAVFELRNFRKEWSVTVPVFLFVGALIANFLIPVQVPETTVTGTLQFADDRTPETGCDPATSDNAKDQPYWSPAAANDDETNVSRRGIPDRGEHRQAANGAAADIERHSEAAAFGQPRVGVFSALTRR